MTTRFYVAILYGAMATGLSLFLHIVPGHAAAAWDGTAPGIVEMNHDILDEIAPRRSGHPEDDDLPAYMTAAETLPEAEPAPGLYTLEAGRDVLAADGPAGLRWTTLAGLGIFGVLCLSAVHARRISDARM